MRFDEALPSSAMALTASIAVQNGCPLWAPTRHTKLLQAHRAYDGPLAGTVAQGDEHFLFYCLAGHVEPASVWLYATVEHDDEVALDEADAETFDAVVERIIATAALEATAGASLPSGMLAVLERARSSWRALLEPLAS